GIAASHHVPARARILGAGEHARDVPSRCTDDGPDRQRSVVVPPQDIVGEIAVEIVIADDMPGGPGIRQRADGGNTRTLHLPERESSVVVLPQNVGVTAAHIEVGCRSEVPVRRHEWKRRLSAGQSAGWGHEPEHVVTGVVTPENVRREAGADADVELRAETIGKCRHTQLPGWWPSLDWRGQARRRGSASAMGRLEVHSLAASLRVQSSRGNLSSNAATLRLDPVSSRWMTRH